MVEYKMRTFRTKANKSKRKRPKRTKRPKAKKKTKGKKKKGRSSSWNKKVSSVFREMKKTNARVTLSSAMKEASRRRKAGQL